VDVEKPVAHLFLPKDPKTAHEAILAFAKSLENEADDEPAEGSDEERKP
jgi:hypothetical protein